MRGADTLDCFVPNLDHCEVTRAIPVNVRATGGVLGRDHAGRIVRAVAVNAWLSDELAAFDADLENLELEPDGEDDPAEDDEG
jgi:hypothetical protein